MQDSLVVLVGVAGFVFHDSPSAPIRGPCWPTRVLPRREDLVPAREKAQNVSPLFPQGLECDMLPLMLHGS